MIDYSDIPRDSRRVPLETRVQFKFDRFSGFISEHSANISPGGMFLRTRTPQPPGTVLELEFRLGDGFELIRGRGEVIWVRAEDEGPARPAGMGIRFQELSEGSRELIYRMVDEHILQGGTPFDVTQTPPDPKRGFIPGPEAPPFPELFDPPPAPPAGAGRDTGSTPNAASWLPPFEDSGVIPASGEPFPELLSASPPQPPVAPASTFAPTFGSASLHRPRRVLPWALLAAGVLLAAVALLLGDRIRDWAGLGEKAETARAALPARPPARRGPAERPAAGAAPLVPTPSPSPVPSAPMAPPAAAVGPATGPALSRLEEVSWEPVAGGTDVILLGNGAIRPEVYRRERLEGNPPRELFRLSGIRSPYPRTRVVVGTAEVLQVRLGYHPEAGEGELHVVLDLAHPSVAVTGVEQGPRRLRIHLRRR
jgi:molecular chaperone DnaK